MAPLHLGVILPNYGPALDAEQLAKVALATEEAGWDSAWVTDHLVVPPDYAETYGTIAEALVTLGFLAGRTERIRLGVSALVVPQRRPLVALKQLTTLDFLSGGRLLTAVTAGWLAAEFAALGASFEERGRVLDEWLADAAALSEQMRPRVRPGGPELWAAGVSRATLRRAAVTGVWHPVALRVEDLRPMVAELRERRADSRVILRLGAYTRREPEAGVDERGRHALAGPPEWIAERLSEYVAAGCDGFVLNLDHQAPGLEERVRQFAEEIAPSVRRAERSG